MHSSGEPWRRRAGSAARPGVVASSIRRLAPEVHPGTAAFTYYLGRNLSRQALDVLGDEIHRVQRALLKDAAPRQLAMLYRGLLEARGSLRQPDGVVFYPGRDETFADQVQELATRLGVATTKTYVEKARGFVLSLSGRKHFNVKQRRSALGSIPYAGQTWDVLVPSGAVPVRRQGRLVTLGACLDHAIQLGPLQADRLPSGTSRTTRRRRPRIPVGSPAAILPGTGAVRLHTRRGEATAVPQELTLEQVRLWLTGRKEP